MIRHSGAVIGATAGFVLLASGATLQAHEPHECPIDVPDLPVIPGHVEQADIIAGLYSFEELIEIGAELFDAQWNTCDGQGRPATTGTGEKRAATQPNFNRISAADSNSCLGCHNQPESGGSGDFVANVFVLGQAADPVLFTTSPEFSNERNSVGMHGAGAIEMLAREMTAELQAQIVGLGNGWHTLMTKGVEFEVRMSGGAVVDSRGVDTDLVVKPFHQAGVVRSLREFTVNAMNHHHGMQSEERFDLNAAKNFDPDFDEDGVERELTIGDITAATIYQAALQIPVQVLPKNRAKRQAIRRGEDRFEDIGCTDCHKPELVLDQRQFVEPYALNPPGTFADDTLPYVFDLTERTGLEKMGGGRAVVRAYTDLKRHNLCDQGGPDPIRYYCNEQLAQGRPDQGNRPGEEYFVTRKLWDVGNSGPWGHRGDLTTISDAILMHGGEARAQRDAFVALPVADQREIVAFLKTLQVVAD